MCLEVLSQDASPTRCDGWSWSFVFQAEPQPHACVCVCARACAAAYERSCGRVVSKCPKDAGSGSRWIWASLLQGMQEQRQKAASWTNYTTILLLPYLPRQLLAKLQWLGCFGATASVVSNFPPAALLLHTTWPRSEKEKARDSYREFLGGRHCKTGAGSQRHRPSGLHLGPSRFEPRSSLSRHQKRRRFEFLYWCNVQINAVIRNERRRRCHEKNVDRIFVDYSAIVAKELESDTLAYSRLACRSMLALHSTVSWWLSSGTLLWIVLSRPRPRRQTRERVWLRRLAPSHGSSS